MRVYVKYKKIFEENYSIFALYLRYYFVMFIKEKDK